MGNIPGGSFYRIPGSETYSFSNETASLSARSREMKFEYHTPTRLIFGAGSLPRLGELA